MNALPEAEAIFGSTSRSDSDALSDRDILLVDQNPTTLKERAAYLQSEGWSVASYTFNKLRALSDNGALFLQHLKGEAQIIRDRGGRLDALLKAYQPKASYQIELQQNSLFASLVSRRPESFVGDLWAADVLYVAVRNYGILRLADEKQYVFSYSKILEKLFQKGALNAEHVDDLLRLRIAKSLYRSRKLDIDWSVGDLVNRCLRQLPNTDFPKSSLRASKETIVRQANQLPAQVSLYHRLRNLERAYLAALADDPSISTCREFKQLDIWIKNPRAYTYSIMCAERPILRQIERMARTRAIAA